MLEYDYYENVKEDVKDYLEEKSNEDCRYFFEDLYDLKQELNDKLFTEDRVTGNASGSYTFNSCEAKEYVLSGGSQILKEAVDEGLLTAESFVDYFLGEDWESLDVICRCYVLSAAIDAAVDEWAEHYAENHQDYLKQLYEEYNN